MEIKKENLALALLKIKSKNPRCPICGSQHFEYDEIETQILSLPEKDGKLQLEIKEASYLRTTPVTCQQCGHILLFNLLTLLNYDRPMGE